MNPINRLWQNLRLEWALGMPNPDRVTMPDGLVNVAKGSAVLQEVERYRSLDNG